MPRKRNTNYTQTRVPGTRAGIYVRVSTDEQARDGYGLAVQRERCRAQATAKGLAVVAEYADEGISGTLDATARPGLADMLAAAHLGEIDTVIVLSLDRLARKTRLVLEIVETLDRARCDLVSVKESLDTTTPQGQFTLTIFAALAQLERDVIVQRTSDGRNERGRRDGERGGRMPMGYRRVGDGLIEVDTDAAPVVRRIFAHRAEGKTLQAIADALNADAVPNPQGGRRWEPATVRAVLQNAPAYRGGPRSDSSTRWPAILN